MAHVVPAARQLIAEIEDVGGKAEPVKELDGLGRHRAIKMNATTTNKLGEDVLAALAADKRVASVEGGTKGTVVTFVSDSRADYAKPFGLADVVR